jgi:hypothetical protein
LHLYLYYLLLCMSIILIHTHHISVPQPGRPLV